MQIAGVPARALTLQGPDTYHFPTWNGMSDPRRVQALRAIVLEYGRDPRVATTAVSILTGDPRVWKKARSPGEVAPRDYKGQAAALLKWVQHHIYYVNEPGERLQSPEYTLREGYGDCDDMAILLASFYESVRLPWKFVLSGAGPKGPVRWTEGEPLQRGWKPAHIYVVVGRPAFTPTRWSYAEPTLRGVPLGWDVVGAHARRERIPLPELGNLLDLSGDWAKIKAEIAQANWHRILVTSAVGAAVSVATTLAIKSALSKSRRR